MKNGLSEEFSEQMQRLETLVAEAQIVSGARAMADQRPVFVEAFSRGQVIEWKVEDGKKGDALLLPPGIGENLAQMGGITRTNTTYSNYNANKMSDAREGKIALGIIRDGAVAAIMMSKDQVLAFMDMAKVDRNLDRGSSAAPDMDLVR